jgi:hypothetical protein
VVTFRKARAAVEDARRTVNGSLVVALIALAVAVIALILGVRK